MVPCFKVQARVFTLDNKYTISRHKIGGRHALANYHEYVVLQNGCTSRILPHPMLDKKLQVFCGTTRLARSSSVSVMIGINYKRTGIAARERFKTLHRHLPQEGEQQGEAGPRRQQSRWHEVPVADMDPDGEVSVISFIADCCCCCYLLFCCCCVYVLGGEK